MNITHQYMDNMLSSGEKRRRLAFSNPEKSLTSAEYERRKEIARKVIKIGICISMLFMILGAIIIAYISTRYMGKIGLCIAFFGTILDVTIGAIIAYNVGNRIQTKYLKEIKTW